MKTLTVILLIAANSLLAAQTPPTDSPTLTTPTPAPTRTYSGGIDYNCNRIGGGPVIKNSPGTILTIHAGGGGGGYSNLYLLLFNKTTAPVAGDVPAIAIPFTRGGVQGDNFGGSADRDYPGGLPMTTGISWALSNYALHLVPQCVPVTLTVTYQ